MLKKGKFGKQQGSIMVEYVLLIVVVALAAIIGFKFLGGKVNTGLTNAGTCIETKGATGC